MGRGFRFGLEPVLKQRKRVEDVAQTEFAMAQAELNQCLKKIDQMYEEIDRARENIVREQKSKEALALERIRQAEKFILGQQLLIERERLRARDLMQKAEDKQQILIEASKERKALGRLKEKRQVEHKKELDLLDEKNTDELVTMRFKRRTS